MPLALRARQIPRLVSRPGGQAVCTRLRGDAVTAMQDFDQNLIFFDLL